MTQATPPPVRVIQSAGCYRLQHKNMLGQYEDMLDEFGEPTNLLDDMKLFSVQDARPVLDKIAKMSRLLTYSSIGFKTAPRAEGHTTIDEDGRPVQYNYSSRRAYYRPPDDESHYYKKSGFYQPTDEMMAEAVDELLRKMGADKFRGRK